MKILKFKKQSKDKYKLYLDNNSDITLYEDVIIKNNLLITKEISDELLEALKKQNNDIYAYTLALGYISVKMRSIKEINDYLIKKGFNNLVASKVSERLIKEGYLNDLKYAKSFINDSMNLTNKGPQKIKMELIKYGVNKDIIESEIALIDQRKVEEKLNKLIDKELKIKKGSQNAIKIKIINHFVNLGYSKDLVTSILMSKEITSDKLKLKKDYAKLYNKYKVKYNGQELLYFISQKLYSKGYTASDIKEVLKEEN